MAIKTSYRTGIGLSNIITKLQVRCVDIQDQITLQQDLDRIQQWADDWGMRFNASKCQVLRISRSQHPMEHFYNINDQVLQQVPSAKYLGVHINQQLKWDTHIDSVTSRANRIIGFLRRNLSLCSTDLKELAYISLARSILEYACQVWDPYTKKDISRIEQVQRRAARFTMRDYSTYSSVTKMLKDLGWEPLAQRRTDARLSLMYQITHGLVAIPTDNILVKQGSCTRASTKGTFRHLKFDSKEYEYSYFPRTIIDWNKLDSSITSADCIDTFRSRLSASRRCD